MTSYALASRLSPFSLSLFGPSPPALSSVPTLAELQKHAERVTEAVPAYTAAPKPISKAGSRLTPWYRGGTPPPSYARDAPLNHMARAKEGVMVKKDGKRLKKKSGWWRLGDEERTPGTEGSRSRAQSASSAWQGSG